ncbi:alpha-tocopherol transfer protein-like isoform X1 [Diorhabda sublineata]|uniref:alpha-tocopherol transfer protein-like isoform X1 n=1 Tax=Diorhabda sublineata TaxID=1163346 RepID=UPI0024E12FF4|nr:alpha-tocopherol transfer protein-like isoform X1 [Diorhabda sublineata]
MSTEELLITNRAQIRKKWKEEGVDVENDIEIIRNWLKTQHHLPEMPSDNMIEFFLTNCKFSIEKTKQNIDMYYTIRPLLPEIYQNTNPCLSENQAVFNWSFVLPLPKLTSSLHRVTLIKFRSVDAELISFTKWVSMFMNGIYEIKMQEDLSMGEILICDLGTLTLAYLPKINPMVIKKAALILEKVWSNRVKGIHLVNVPAIADVLISILKSAVSKKIKERIYIHGKLEDLFDYVSKDILPCDYGGMEKSMDELNELWKNKLTEYKDRFLMLEKMKIDEDVRPAPLKNSDLLGYYGNFKKIDID